MARVRPGRLGLWWPRSGTGPALPRPESYRNTLAASDDAGSRDLIERIGLLPVLRVFSVNVGLVRKSVGEAVPARRIVPVFVGTSALDVDHAS
jgi:hypothetical protein